MILTDAAKKHLPSYVLTLHNTCHHLLLLTSWVRTIPLKNKLDSCYLFMYFAHMIVSNCSALQMVRNIAGKFTRRWDAFFAIFSHKIWITEQTNSL